VTAESAFNSRYLVLRTLARGARYRVEDDQGAAALLVTRRGAFATPIAIVGGFFGSMLAAAGTLFVVVTARLPGELAAFMVFGAFFAAMIAIPAAVLSRPRRATGASAPERAWVPASRQILDLALPILAIYGSPFRRAHQYAVHLERQRRSSSPMPPRSAFSIAFVKAAV
jgi:hypothetical protein